MDALQRLQSLGGVVTWLTDCSSQAAAIASSAPGLGAGDPGALTPAGSGLTYGGAQLVNGCATSVGFDGIASQFSKAVAAGAWLDTLAAGASIGMWVQYAAVQQAGTYKGLLNWNSNNRLQVGIRTGAPRRVFAGCLTATPAPFQETVLGDSGAGTVDTTPILVGASYSPDTGEVHTVMHGVVDRRVVREGLLLSGADTFIVGHVATQRFAGQGALAFVANRQLDEGEWRALYEDGQLLANKVVQVAFPVVDLGLASGVYGGGLAGGSIDQTKHAVVQRQVAAAPGGQRPIREDAYKLAARHRPARHMADALAMGAEGSDYWIKTLNYLTSVYSLKAAPGDSMWLDPTTMKFHISTNAEAAQRSMAMFVQGLALAHRVKKAPKTFSWAQRFAEQVMETAISFQATQALGNIAPVGTDAYFAHLSLTVAAIALAPSQDRTTRARWITALKKSGNYIDSASERYFYSNGNIELLASTGLYALYKLTAEQEWLDRFNTRIALVFEPTTALGTSGSGGNAVATGFGLRDGSATNPSAAGVQNGAAVTLAAALAMNPLTAQLYLAEATSGAAAGIDIDYLQVQLGMLVTLHLLSGDARWLTLAQMFANKLWTFFQQTTSPTAPVAPVPSAAGGTMAAGDYAYSVTAVISGGESMPTAEQTVTIPAGGTGSAAGFSWGAPASVLAGAVASWNVRVRKVADGTVRRFNVAAGTTVFNDTGAAGTADATNGMSTIPTKSQGFNWTLDARNGSRHNLLTAYILSSFEYLRLKAARNDFNFDAAHHARFVVAQYQANLYNNNNENFYTGGGSLGEYATMLAGTVL